MKLPLMSRMPTQVLYVLKAPRLSRVVSIVIRLLEDPRLYTDQGIISQPISKFLYQEILLVSLRRTQGVPWVVFLVLGFQGQRCVTMVLDGLMEHV